MAKEKKQKRRLKLSGKIVLIIAALMLTAGIGFLVFSSVSNFFGQQKANAIIADFNDSLENVVPNDDNADTPAPYGITSKSFEAAKEKGEVDDEGYPIDKNGNRTSGTPVVFEYDLDALYRDSVAYNKGLINHQGTIDTSDYSRAALNMSKYGLSNIYCYMSIPAIDLYLPVYLGANDSMMSCGAAHLSSTSLPVDMKDTNVAIAGHTDYIGRIFFDNIRKLETGNRVIVHNYWGTIEYKVIGYKVVKPNDTADIYIQSDKQLMTLITCIPSKNGGFDRYLVICGK